MGGSFWLGSNKRARRERWGAAMRELTIQPTTMDELLHEIVTVQRGNQLILLTTREWITPGGPVARWMHSKSFGIDLIWHHPDITGSFRDQALGHEGGHMVNGDEPAPIDFELVQRAITSNFKHVDPQLIESALARTTFDKATEREAESFSDWANAWIERTRARHGGAKLLTNVRASLETRSEYW